MNFFLLLPVTGLLSFTFYFSPHFSIADSAAIKDTSIIKHMVDGSTSEWPDNKFITDEATNIIYAMDNDTSKLYLALRVNDSRMQMKMMRNGMNLYIDMKGKKKEKNGIEFPIKKESSDLAAGDYENQQNNQDNQQIYGNEKPRKPDMKAFRNSLALTMTYMRVFGFENSESVDHGLQMAGKANIAFAWDSSNVMYIEYSIPLKMLNESIDALSDKSISIGWKINGVELKKNSSENSSYGNGEGMGRGGGRGGGFNRGSFGEGDRQAERDKMMQPQNIWTKYTFQSLSK